MAKKDFVAYYRVATARQGRSRRGLEAQRQAVSVCLGEGGGTLRREFVEVESVKGGDRPQLERALRLCRQTGATLVIARLDRLSRDARFLLGLETAGVEFVAADMPGANRMTVGIMALVAEQEREAISRRTREALAAAKKRGVKLGNPNGARALLRAGKGNKAAIRALKLKADRHASALLPEIEELRAKGVTSLQGLAAALNERGMQTPRGARWHASSVRNLLARLAA